MFWPWGAGRRFAFGASVIGAGERREIRNSKSEIRKKSEGEKAKLEKEGRVAGKSFRTSGFPHFLPFGFFSGFGFPASDFPPGRIAP